MSREKLSWFWITAAWPPTIKAWALCGLLLAAKIPKIMVPIISGVMREGKRVYVDVAQPNAQVEMFVEGPTEQWALPEPKPVDHSPAGMTRFAFELDGLPPDTPAEGAALRFTLVAPDTALEYSVSLN